MSEEKKKSNIDEMHIPKILIEEKETDNVLEDEEAKGPKPLGWDEIDKRLEKLYKNTKPLHFGNISPFGEKKLKGISVYNVRGDNPHWHFITYGLTELYEKESDNKEKNGYGFELTFRLKKDRNETDVPNWAINFLNNIANYIFKTGTIFNEGHYLNTNGPISTNRNTDLKAIVFSRDVKLNEILKTPNGEMKFIQITGITLDELEAMIAWNTDKVLDLLELPFNITDLDRESKLSEVAVEKIEKGIESEGSSTKFLYVDNARMEIEYRYILTLEALYIKNLKNLFKGVVLKGEVLTIYSDYKINFVLSIENKVEKNDINYNIYFTKETVGELIERLETKAQIIILDTFNGFDVIIEESYIKDRYGNIINVIG